LRRSEVKEFHYIARYENVRSILELGILSNERAAVLKPVSFAMETAQERRSRKIVSPGRSVHTYANVYFDAHNPTLSARRKQNACLAILRVAPDVLEIPGTFIATQNAASDGVRFYCAAEGLAYVDAERVYAPWWTTDPATRDEWSRLKCAEVLVPDVIPPQHILGAYACSTSSKEELRALAPGLAVVIPAGFYF
jgi:hypothetical protein